MLQFITLLVIAGLVLTDQLIKVIVLKYLAPVGSYVLVNKFLSLTYVENTGAAFGSFSSNTVILSVVTAAVVIVGLIYLLRGKIKNKLAYWCITVIISGGIGNLIDRIFRGFVVDYIEPLFVNFAVFNFADILVTCGAIILIIYLIYDMVKDAKNGKKEKTDE